MKTLTIEEFDKKFDNGEDISEFLDFSKPVSVKDFFEQINEEYEDVHIHFPKKVLQMIDSKIKEIGIDRESFIKMIVAERLNIIKS